MGEGHRLAILLHVPAQHAAGEAVQPRLLARRRADPAVIVGDRREVIDQLQPGARLRGAVRPGKGARGISLFLVDKGLPGLTIGRDQPMMGLRGTSHVELAFDEVPLESAAMLGAEGEGFRMALGVLGRVRLAQVGARSIGKATKVMDLMLDYARARHQFGQAIGDFQMIQQMLADSAVEINAARLALWQTAAEMDAGRDPRARISLVKVQAAETLGRVVDRAVQVFGGMGFCKDLPIERYYRDARIYRIFDGTSEIHRTVMARTLLKGDSSLYDPWTA